MLAPELYALPTEIMNQNYIIIVLVGAMAVHAFESDGIHPHVIEEFYPANSHPALTITTTGTYSAPVTGSLRPAIEGSSGTGYTGAVGMRVV